MQTHSKLCPVVPTPVCRCRATLLRSPKPLGHALHRVNGTVIRSSAATEAEPATPLVSDNAAAEVPHAEVADQDTLSAAMAKTESGPDTAANVQRQQQQQRSPNSGGRSNANGAGRSGGRSRRPRTVGPEQLVPGAQFDGNVVSADLSYIHDVTRCHSMHTKWQSTCLYCSYDWGHMLAGVCFGIWCLCGHWSSHRWSCSHFTTCGKPGRCQIKGQLQCTGMQQLLIAICTVSACMMLLLYSVISSRLRHSAFFLSKLCAGVQCVVYPPTLLCFST